VIRGVLSFHVVCASANVFGKVLNTQFTGMSRLFKLAVVPFPSCSAKYWNTSRTKPSKQHNGDDETSSVLAKVVHKPKYGAFYFLVVL
jgi:hypothetical protein